jgi:hypothetical protein
MSKSVKTAIALFFLAPLFGEYLLGNLKFSEIALLPFIAPLYGGGAILIRETTRRMGRGYGTMWGLGLAYALWAGDHAKRGQMDGAVRSDFQRSRPARAFRSLQRNTRA